MAAIESLTYMRSNVLELESRPFLCIVINVVLKNQPPQTQKLCTKIVIARKTNINLKNMWNAYFTNQYEHPIQGVPQPFAPCFLR